MYTITHVSDKPSSTGKTVRCLLNHPDFPREVTLFANIPLGMAPRKWDKVVATTVKVGEIETEWKNDTTGESGVLAKPQRQISFFGEVELQDGDPLPPTTWVDKRKPVEPATVVEESF